MKSDAEKVDYADVSPQNDGFCRNRLLRPLPGAMTVTVALMGSNMQRQAVPLMKVPTAHRATGVLEYKGNYRLRHRSSG